MWSIVRGSSINGSASIHQSFQMYVTLEQFCCSLYNGDKYDFSDKDHCCVLILDNNIYEHTYLRINYTTYDLWWDQDSINPRSHPNVMLLSQEDERSHPYWYAHVCLVFHAMVQHCNNIASPYSKPEWMDILFVHWF